MPANILRVSQISSSWAIDLLSDNRIISHGAVIGIHCKLYSCGTSITGDAEVIL